MAPNAATEILVLSPPPSSTKWRRPGVERKKSKRSPTLGRGARLSRASCQTADDCMDYFPFVSSGRMARRRKFYAIIRPFGVAMKPSRPMGRC
jgi:hypothetical protein